MAVVFADSVQHGWRWIRSATETPISWLDLDLVVLSVLYLLVPERRWKQNRRTVAVTLVLVLTVSLGGYLVSLSQKGAVRSQTGYDMVHLVEMNRIPRENVPDFVLNGTDTYTIDFSGTVTIANVMNTRTIYAETTFPGLHSQEDVRAVVLVSATLISDGEACRRFYRVQWSRVPPARPGTIVSCDRRSREELASQSMGLRAQPGEHSGAVRADRHLRY